MLGSQCDKKITCDKKIIYEKEIKYLEGECWYGLCVEDGYHFPLNSHSDYSKNIDPNTTCNQAASLLLSNKGRYIYSEYGIEVISKNGILYISSSKSQIYLFDGYDDLKGAFLAASNKHFPPEYESVPDEFFTQPCFNTWIELMYEQTQEGIMEYAENLLKNGYTSGIIMIDDGWNEDYGVWEFDPKKFTEPKAMIQRLHEMGFKVMLWVCPFVSPDSRVFRELRDQNVFIKNSDETIAVREWWNGYSAVLDMSSHEANAWFHKQLKYLMKEYGVDGFKFDAGDGYFYQDQDIYGEQIDANQQIQRYMEFGRHYPYNEFRVSFHYGGKSIIHRISDKKHSWGLKGLASLIPNLLTQGILGYPFTSPDMIGGGEYTSFLENSTTLDSELLVRYSQVAALMPIMQYSVAPWRVLSEQDAKLCLASAQIRQDLKEEILSVVKATKETGEPVARYMEYEFPKEGMEYITDQFMLGSDILVAPVLEKGAVKRRVTLPKGKWRYVDCNLYEGGCTIEVEAPLHTIPYFRKES